MTSIQNETKGRLASLVAIVAAVALALVLAGCSSGSAPSSSSSAGSSSASSPSTSASAESSSSTAASAESTEIDTVAFDELVSSGPVADDADIAASDWATKVKEAGTLRIGGVQTSQLFSLKNTADGAVRGFDAGLVQLLSNYILGDSDAYEYTQVTSDTRESVLQNDQVDAVVATYTINAKRSEIISFAGPYFTSQYSVLTLAGNDDIASVDDLDGKVVAVQSGSTGPEIADEYAPGATQQAFSTDEEARAALEQGRVDAYIYDFSMNAGSILSNPGKYKIAGEVFGPEDPYGVGLPLDSDGVEFVNGFLEKIEADGTWAELWEISIGDRTGVDEAPDAPTVGDLSFLEA